MFIQVLYYRREKYEIYKSFLFSEKIKSEGWVHVKFQIKDQH